MKVSYRLVGLTKAIVYAKFLSLVKTGAVLFDPGVHLRAILYCVVDEQFIMVKVRGAQCEVTLCL